MTDRFDKLLYGIDRTARILEIGPSFNPAAPKKGGWHTYVLDHASQEELKRIYQDHDVDCDKIEPVDFVWTGGPIHEAVPTLLHGRFNACIASHVIEHLPNPISFFQSLDRLLTEDGIISLAVPDKRYCFDFFRPPTFLPAWVEAYEKRSNRHSHRALFEHFAYHSDNGHQFTWDQSAPVMHLNLRNDLTSAKGAADRAGLSEVDPYVDCHAWCFTPSSFALLILEISLLGLTNFHVARSYPTEGCEFITSLRRGGDLHAAQKRRMELMKAIVTELGEQRDQMRRGFIFTALRRRVARKLSRLLSHKPHHRQ